MFPILCVCLYLWYYVQQSMLCYVQRYSMPVVVVAWVSIVQFTQLGTTNIYHNSDEALNRYFCITLHLIGLSECWYNGEYENPDRTRLDQRSIFQGSKISCIIHILFWSPIALIHYPPCSNLAKNAIALNEEHKLTTAQQLKTLYNALYNKG